MKKIIFATLLYVAAFKVDAQLSKTDGPVEKGSGKIDLQSVIGSDNNAFYTFRKDDDKMFVQRYNKKTLVKESQTEVVVKQKSFKVRDWNSKSLCFLKNNQIYLYVPVADKDKDRAILLLSIIGTDGKIISDFKEVGYLNDQFATSRYFNTQAGAFTFSLSPDSTKMVFVMTYFIIGVGNQQTISTVDLKNSKPLSEKEVSNSYRRDQDKVVQLTSYAIDNDGKLAYGYVHYDKSQGGNIFAIDIYDPVTKIEKTISPNFGGANKIVMESSDMIFLKNNKLLFSSILTDNEKQKDKKKNSLIYIARFDAVSGKADFEPWKYFSEEWRVKYDPAKVASAGASGHCNYDFKYTLINDGSVIVSAFKRGGWNVHGNSLDDAVIVKLNSAGKIDWMKTMPIKEIIDEKDGLKNYLSFTYFNNKMYYIFNDEKSNEKNIDLSKVEASEETKATKKPYGSDINTTCITIDMAGNMQRFFIGNNKELGFYPLDKIIWLDKNHLLMYYSKNGWSEQFSILTLQ